MTTACLHLLLPPPPPQEPQGDWFSVCVGPVFPPSSTALLSFFHLTCSFASELPQADFLLVLGIPDYKSRPAWEFWSPPWRSQPSPLHVSDCPCSFLQLFTALAHVTILLLNLQGHPSPCCRPFLKTLVYPVPLSYIIWSPW